MNKVDWRPRRPKDYAYARIGRICMNCNSWTTLSGNYVWYASVSLNSISSSRRQGPRRRSLAKAKSDAVRLAREMLDDYRMAIDIETKNFE